METPSRSDIACAWQRAKHVSHAAQTSSSITA